MAAMLLAIALVALEQPLTVERLSGLWCLQSTANDRAVIDQQVQWRFESDGEVFVGTDPTEPTEGAYDINGEVIQTSLALQLQVEEFSEELMVAINGDTVYRFTRGECEGVPESE